MRPAVAFANPRQLRSARRTPWVVVTGGKGGVGKTTLAVNAALALARRGRRVLLVDLDLGLADAHVLLGLAPERTLEHVLAGTCGLRECTLKVAEGLDLLPAGAGTPELAHLGEERRARLTAALRAHAAAYDLVVADSAAGIGEDVLGFCQAADHVLLVTTPEPAALADAYGLLKALHVHGERCGREIPTPEVVINRASGLEEAELAHSRLRTLCERFLSRSPRSAGWLPASGAAQCAAQFQRPFGGLLPAAGTGLLSACLARLAGRLERLCPPSSASRSVQT